MNKNKIFLSIIGVLAGLAIIFAGYQYQHKKTAAKITAGEEQLAKQKQAKTNKTKQKADKNAGLGPENIKNLQTEEEKAVAKIPKHPVKVIAHRGSPKEQKIPENTFASFDASLKEGIKTIDMPLRTTVDGEFVVFSDDNLIRLFQNQAVVADTKLTNLQENKYSNGEPIHSLAEIFKKYDTKLNYVLEYRKSPTTDEAQNHKEIDGLITLIKKYALGKKVTIASYDLESLNYLAEKAPNMKKMLLVNNEKKDILDSDVKDVKNIQIISVQDSLLNDRVIKKYRDAGLKIYIFIPNEGPDAAKQMLIYNDLDGIITDYAGKTSKMLAEQGRD